jgi:isopropylmalate/homocitrate/citramalate synthase
MPSGPVRLTIYTVAVKSLEAMNTTILDTTLREGELFKIFNRQMKVQIAKKLAETGVRRIELTVDYPPRTTEADVSPVVDILSRHEVSIILHGRAYDEDIKSMLKYNVQGCALYMSLSQLHLEYKLRGLGYEEALKRLAESVSKARSAGLQYVRATVEDASRLFLEGERGLDKLVKAVERLKDAGATIVSVPDTAGLLAPRQAAEMVRVIKRRTDTPLAAHFHNDYGMASSNTVEAVLEGVEEAHVSIMGIGDRNGIADMYEVVAILEDVYGYPTGIARGSLSRLYQFFSKITGIRNCWRHPLSEEARTVRAGVHQAMTVNRPEGYMPGGKLKNDFHSPSYNLGPYVSHRLVASIIGNSRGDEEIRKITNLLAEEAKSGEGYLSISRFREIVRRETGLDLDPAYLEKYISGEKVYVLTKLDPRAPVREVLRELRSWDEVESVDEVYGDVDLVIIGRMTYSRDNLVNRLRKKYSDVLEDVKVLVTD